MAAVCGEVFNREKGSYDSDFLDDSALIKAFDNAVNPIKAMMGETHSAGPAAAAASSNKAKKKSQKRNNGKSKRKDELRSDTGANGSGQKPSEWQVGSRCRAVYSADGELYDAVIVSVDGEAGTCTVRYDYYNNEEFQRLDDLMLPSSDVSASVQRACSNSVRSDAASCGSVDSMPSGCGGHLPHATCNHHHPPPQLHHQHHHQRSCHTSTRKARRQFRPVPPFHPPGRSFPPPPGMPPPFLPPGMMPEHLPHSSSFPIFPPPPPPSPSMTAGDVDEDKESLYNMLISWYMCGYYTGFHHGRSSGRRGGVADSTVTGTTSEDADESFTQDHVH